MSSFDYSAAASKAHPAVLMPARPTRVAGVDSQLPAVPGRADIAHGLRLSKPDTRRKLRVD